MCSARRFLPLAAALAFAGCTVPPTPEEERLYNAHMTLGEGYFRNAKFQEAVNAYTRAAEMRRSSFHAWLGLASSAAEYSHSLYAEAANLFELRKRDAALRALERADRMHEAALKAFTKCTEIRAGDVAIHYNQAVMFYKRSTSPYGLPYPAVAEPPPELKLSKEDAEKWKQGVEQRRKERDLAIQEFEKVLARDKYRLDDAAHVKNCISPQSHRYVGILYFVRGEWEKGDTERMRQQIAFYLVWVRGAREEILHRPVPPELKTQREKELATFDRELLELQDLMRGWLRDLRDYQAKLELKQEEPRLPDDKREARADSLRREILLVEALVAEFDKGRSGSNGRKGS